MEVATEELTEAMEATGRGLLKLLPGVATEMEEAMVEDMVDIAVAIVLRATEVGTEVATEAVTEVMAREVLNLKLLPGVAMEVDMVVGTVEAGVGMPL